VRIKFLLIVLVVVALLAGSFTKTGASSESTLWSYNLAGGRLGLIITAHINYHVSIFNDSGAYKDYAINFYYGGRLVSSLTLDALPSSLELYHPVTVWVSLRNVGNLYTQAITVTWFYEGRLVSVDNETTHLDSTKMQRLLITDQYD